MLSNLVNYANEVSALSKDNALLSTVVFKKDSWYTPYVNPQSVEDCLEFLLIKLFE